MILLKTVKRTKPSIEQRKLFIQQMGFEVNNFIDSENKRF